MRWLATIAAMLLALPAAAQGRVEIDTGALQGRTQGGISTYFGIPFAAPPVGANRWRAPQPVAKWQGVRDATRFGSACQQNIIPNRGAIGPWTWEYLPQDAVSEDCLFINVWTPAASPGARLPVFYWIYGGGFTDGSGAVPIYDGSALAARGIVVVTVNYRVGAYGFLAHPELTKEAGSSGNYGLLDQIAGLEWVRRNIAAFGGDPGRVTIAGQSAGAASVHALIASPKAKGLFVRAIAQSGSGLTMGWPSQADSEALGLRFAEAAGAKSLADLRALTPAQIAAASRGSALGGRRFSLTNGTSAFPDLGATVSDVPVLTGLTADEGSAFDPEYALTDGVGIRKAIEARYGKSAAAFIALYPAPDPATAGASARAMVRDRGIAAMLAWAGTRRGKAPVYGYLWTHAEPGPDRARYRAFHSSEVPYVFDTLDAAPERGFTAADHAIARRTGDYWANFVKTGNPNGRGLPAWPALTRGGRIMELGDRFAPRAPLSPAVRAAFDAYRAAGGRVALF